jgi:hypothetical protein
MMMMIYLDREKIYINEKKTLSILLERKKNTGH